MTLVKKAIPVIALVALAACATVSDMWSGGKTASVKLSGAEENPPVKTSASGSGSFTLAKDGAVDVESAIGCIFGNNDLSVSMVKSETAGRLGLCRLITFREHESSCFSLFQLSRLEARLSARGLDWNSIVPRVSSEVVAFVSMPSAAMVMST